MDRASTDKKHSLYIKVSLDAQARRREKPQQSTYIPSSSPPCSSCPKWNWPQKGK